MTSNPPGITTRLPKVLPDDLPEDSIQLDVYHLMKLLKPTKILVETIKTPPLPTLNPPNSASSLEERWEALSQRYFPPRRGWVLRNLTKKMYVYADPPPTRDQVSGPVDVAKALYLTKHNLGIIIAFLTLWWGNRSVPMSNSWAGGCFDMVVEDILKEAIAGGEMWLDVTTWARGVIEEIHGGLRKMSEIR